MSSTSLPSKLCCAVVLMSAGLSGCAPLPRVCVPPAQSMVTAEMLFGRNIGDHVGVSKADFTEFVAAEITPRFPEGLTVVDARGQWRNARGELIREPSEVVLLTFRDVAQKHADLDAIADAYKRKFHQQSVLMTVRAVCVTF